MSGDWTCVLDLGSSKIVALVAEPAEDGGVSIVALESAPCKGLKRGAIVDLEETARTIDALARKLSAKLGRELTDFVVSAAGPHVEGTNAQGFKEIIPRNRSITHQDVMEVIQHSRSILLAPDREQIQAIPREFRIDNQRNILRPVGMTGGKLEVVTYLVSNQTAQVQNVQRALNLTGKNLEQLVLGPLASGIAVLTPEELEIGTAVLDFGAGKTDMAIFSQGSLAYSCSIPIGSALITSDISKLLKTAPEEAERLKLESGCALAGSVSEQEIVEVRQLGQPMARPMQKRVLAEIIESRVREMTGMVKGQLEKSGFQGLLPGGFVLTGGGAKLDKCDVLLRSVVGAYPVRKGAPEIGGDVDPFGYGVAVGMAQFVIQISEELEPIDGAQTWQDRVKSLWSLLKGKAE